MATPVINKLKLKLYIRFQLDVAAPYASKRIDVKKSLSSILI